MVRPWRVRRRSGTCRGGARRARRAPALNRPRPRPLRRASLRVPAWRAISAYAQECLQLARELGDLRGQCDGLTGLAREAQRAGDYTAVTEYAAEGVRKARAAGDRAAEGSPLHLLAAGTRLSGDYDRARELYLESVALAEQVGDDRRKQVEVHNLGWVELHRGDVDAAERMFAERDAGSDLDAMTDAWAELSRAGIALVRGERDEAARRFDVGKRQLEKLGAALDPDDEFEFDWLRAQLTT